MVNVFGNEEAEAISVLMLHFKFEDVISKPLHFLKHFLRPYHV